MQNIKIEITSPDKATAAHIAEKIANIFNYNKPSIVYALEIRAVSIAEGQNIIIINEPKKHFDWDSDLPFEK